jgi:hypothetical protein
MPRRYTLAWRRVTAPGRFLPRPPKPLLGFPQKAWEVAAMKHLDEAVLEVVELHGPLNEKGITNQPSKGVYKALQRLVEAKKIVKVGYQGKGNEKKYQMPKTKPTITRRLS